MCYLSIHKEVLDSHYFFLPKVKGTGDTEMIFMLALLMVSKCVPDFVSHIRLLCHVTYNRLNTSMTRVPKYLTFLLLHLTLNGLKLENGDYQGCRVRGLGGSGAMGCHS